MAEAGHENTSIAGSDVGARYATALFDLATEQQAREGGAVARVEADLMTLGGMLAKSEDLRALVTGPVYSAQEQSDAMQAVLAIAALSPLIGNLVGVLIANSRLSVLGAVIREFRRLAAAARGEIGAEAVSAYPLDAAQLDHLKAEIERIIGQTTTLNTRLDPSLLGGLIVKIGSRMVDDSLRSKLNRLKHNMKEA